MKSEKVDILIIDDDPIARFLIGNKIKTCASEMSLMELDAPQLAIEYLSRPDTLWPDIILSDINMPGMNGWEMIKILTPQLIKHPDTRVFMVTSSESISDLNALKEQPRIQDLLVKPLTIENVEMILEVEVCIPSNK